MKLVSYIYHERESLGVLVGDTVIHLPTVLKSRSMPDDCVTMMDYLRGSLIIAEVLEWVTDHITEAAEKGIPLQDLQLLAPVPHPTSMRDGYAFRQHVEAARRNRGLAMIPEFDEIPIFYFTNHQAVFGPGIISVMSRHMDKLDFELECAVVIGREGRNISASKADQFVAGLMVMNDWSARGLQMEEMKLNLGPAKGKDFATSLGPWLTTLDELADRIVETPVGNQYDLEMTASVNGTIVSRGNVKDMTWTFAQIIERASYGVTLYPGDVIGSGTCGTGCFLELNGSGLFPEPWWLKDSDVVECSIERLGTLSNTVVLSD